MTKYIICLGDGMADHPIPEFNSQTVLEAANIPNMDYMSKNGTLGLVNTIPKGYSPGSDVANMSILGFEADKYYSGRGPIEAASIGVKPRETEIIFRCNLVTIENNHLVDFTADHIETETSKKIVNDLNIFLKPYNMKLITGVSYRHILITDEKFADLSCEAAHNIIDQPIDQHFPKGKQSEKLIEVIKQCHIYLKSHPINKTLIKKGKKPVTGIWPYGQGKIPSYPSFKEKYNLTGGIVTAVDLLKGIGVLAGLETPTVKGATGFIDTNYEEKMSAAFDILNEHDFCYIHIEAPDECGHMGDPHLKKKAIEDFDQKVIKPVLDYSQKNEDVYILVLPDHPTPCELKTHTNKPVPFILFNKKSKKTSNLPYNENTSKKTNVYFNSGPELLHFFLNEK